MFQTTNQISICRHCVAVNCCVQKVKCKIGAAKFKQAPVPKSHWGPWTWLSSQSSIQAYRVGRITNHRGVELRQLWNGFDWGPKTLSKLVLLCFAAIPAFSIWHIRPGVSTTLKWLKYGLSVFNRSRAGIVTFHNTEKGFEVRKIMHWKMPSGNLT